MLDNIFRVVNNYNDLDKLKIYNLISQKGGGSSYMLKLIFGIILIVIGVIFGYIPSNYSSTNATVENVTTDNLYKYVTVNYTIKDKQYTKQVILGRNHNLVKNSTITLYFDKNDPNIINLDTFNYYIMSFIFILFGLYLIFMNNPTSKVRNDTSIYTSDANLSDINIV
jgi:hypothetical protein